MNKNNYKEDEFLKLFYNIANKEFNYTGNIPIEFENTNTLGAYLCSLKYKQESGEGYIQPQKFIFSNKLLSKSQKKIEMVIRHELIHWYIYNEKWNDTITDYFLLFVPHGIRFIKESIKHKNNYLYYILGGFLDDIQWKGIIQIILNILNGNIKVSFNK